MLEPRWLTWVVGGLVLLVISLAVVSMVPAGEVTRAQINEAPRPRVDLIVGSDYKDPYSLSAHAISYFQESAWLDRYVRQADVPVGQRTIWHGVYPTNGPIYRGTSWMVRRIPKVPAVLVTGTSGEVLYFAVAGDPDVPLPTDAATLERNVRYALSGFVDSPAIGGYDTQLPSPWGRGAEFAGTPGNGVEASVFGQPGVVVDEQYREAANLQPGPRLQFTESLDQGPLDNWRAKRAAKKAGTSGGAAGPADDEPPPTPKSAATPLQTVAPHPSGQPAQFCENGECRTTPNVQQSGGILSGLNPFRREPQPDPYTQPQQSYGAAQWPGGGVQVDPYGVQVRTPRGNVDVQRQYADPYMPPAGQVRHPVSQPGRPYTGAPGFVYGQQLPPALYAEPSANLAAPAYGYQQQRPSTRATAPGQAIQSGSMVHAANRRRGGAVPSGWSIRVTGVDFEVDADGEKLVWKVGKDGEVSSGEFKLPVAPKATAPRKGSPKK